MKIRNLALLGALAFSMPAFAAEKGCRVNYTAGEQVDQVMQQVPFAFEGYAQLCNWLEVHKLSVVITGDKGVLQGRSYGWATVRLQRRATNVISYAESYSTAISNNVDAASATLALSDAINRAMLGIAAGKDEYLASVDREEGRLRVLLAK